MLVTNHTPFEAGGFGLADTDGGPLLLCVLKATWSFANPAAIVPAEVQQPIAAADRYRGPMETSSLLYASDLSIRRPQAEIALEASAHADPNDNEAEVGVQVGHWSKKLRVYGERLWHRHFGRIRPGSPMSFQQMPLIYEHAFGGEDTETNDRDMRNPVGRGFYRKGSKRDVADLPVPNIEAWNHPITSPTTLPEPAALGFIPPHWQPRAGFAGTYDAAWREERYPLLPEDFDPRFFLAVPSDQVYPGFLEGGEGVTLIGLDAQRHLRFQLPRLKPGCVVTLGHRSVEVPLQWDRLWLDVDARQVVGCFSGFQPLDSLREVFEVRFDLEVQSCR